MHHKAFGGQPTGGSESSQIHQLDLEGGYTRGRGRKGSERGKGRDTPFFQADHCHCQPYGSC